MSEILLILTTTVHVNWHKHFIFQSDSQERINTYIKSIKQWLEKTKIRICVVENSGYTFPELDDYKNIYADRFEIITFNEATLPENLIHLYYNRSKGAGEMYSIIHAFNNTKFREETKFVIKLTGRYFIDSFEEYLLFTNLYNRVKNVAIDDDDNMVIGLRQNNENRCELMGIHVRLFHILFELRLTNDDNMFHPHVEYVYKNRFKLLNQQKMLVCPTFPIEPTQMGGGNLITTEL